MSFGDETMKENYFNFVNSKHVEEGLSISFSVFHSSGKFLVYLICTDKRFFNGVHDSLIPFFSSSLSVLHIMLTSRWGCCNEMKIGSCTYLVQHVVVLCPERKILSLIFIFLMSWVEDVIDFKCLHFKVSSIWYLNCTVNRFMRKKISKENSFFKMIIEQIFKNFSIASTYYLL